jgi:hypothetical protein
MERDTTNYNKKKILIAGPVSAVGFIHVGLLEIKEVAL